MGHFNGANGIWWEQYVQFDGRLLWYYTQATNVSRYFHVNALGSLGLATDQTGAPVEEMLHYPFGKEWVNTAGFGWDEKFARFPQHDNDLGMYMTAFRQYNPGLGRWLTPDKLAGNITNPQSLNRYAYALNNPVSNIDPLGLQQCRPGAPNYENDCAPTGDGSSADTSVDTSSLNHLAQQNSFPGVAPSDGTGGGGTHGQQSQTSKCTISNGRTTGVGPGQATGPGAFGLYPSRHPGMVAIDPGAIGLVPGRPTNHLLTQYASQITIRFSPMPKLPVGFPTTFKVGDILDPKSRVGGVYFNGRYDFDIYGFPSNAATRRASGPRTVTITYPSVLPFNCGGPLGDAILPPSGQS